MLRFLKTLFIKVNKNKSVPQAIPVLENNQLGMNKVPLVFEFRQVKNFQELPDLYWIFINQNATRAEDARNNVCELLREVKPTQIIKIDHLCRHKTSIGWYSNWHLCDPNECIPSNVSVSERILLLGFASFHPNGHVREKAIKSLEMIANAETLPFLLIRMNDWVGIIRDAAYKAIEGLLKKEFTESFINNLRLVERLTTCGRAQHTEIISNIFNLISNSEESMEYGLSFSDPYIRQLCFSIAVEKEEFSNAYIFGFLKKDKSGQVRANGLRIAQRRLNEGNCKEYLHCFLEDKNMRVRVLALDIYCKYYLVEAKEILLAQLFSIYVGARETATFYLKKLGVANFRELYIREITRTNIPNAALIAGLGVSGKKDDAKLIIPFLCDPHDNIVKTTIKSLSQLKIDSLVSTILPFLADRRPGVSREASNVLLNCKGELSVDEISKYLDSINPLNVRKNAFRIIDSLNMFDSLPYILEYLKCGLPELESLASEALEYWRIRAIRAYVKPTKMQLQKIMDSMSSVVLEKHIKDEILFKIKS